MLSQRSDACSFELCFFRKSEVMMKKNKTSETNRTRFWSINNEFLQIYFIFIRNQT